MKIPKLFTFFTFAIFTLALCVSCDKDDNDSDDSGSGSGSGSAKTGTIVVENAYTSTGYGSINTVAIINSQDKYVKTSTKTIKKGEEGTFTDIPVDTYTIKITISTHLGTKIIEKSGVKVNAGNTAKVVFK